MAHPRKRHRKPVGELCVYCNEPAVLWDHMDALAAGGADDASNLTPCCRPCNAAKSSSSALVFLAWRRNGGDVTQGDDRYFVQRPAFTRWAEEAQERFDRMRDEWAARIMRGAR